MSGILVLFFEFLKIGLFSVGGGLATLPFLYDLADKYNWFSQKDIGNMIAISESTPGPLGVNMAAYVGYLHSGILGGVVATIGIVLPSLVIIIGVSKVLQQFQENRHVDHVFHYLRPGVTGLIATAGCSVIIGALFPFGLEALLEKDFFIAIGIKELILFFIMLFLTNKYKIHPVCYIAIGAVIGIVFMF